MAGNSDTSSNNSTSTVVVAEGERRQLRTASLRSRDTGVQHCQGQGDRDRGAAAGERRASRKLPRQRSVQPPASPRGRRPLNSPPPKQTPPLMWEPLGADPEVDRSPPRRVSTPLYVVGSPPPPDMDQAGLQHSTNKIDNIYIY